MVVRGNVLGGGRGNQRSSKRSNIIASKKSNIIKGVAVSGRETPRPPLPSTTSCTVCAGRDLRRRSRRTFRQGRPVKHRLDIRKSRAGGQRGFTVSAGDQIINVGRSRRGAVRRRECTCRKGGMEVRVYLWRG